MSGSIALHRSEIDSAIYSLIEKLPNKVLQNKLWKQFSGATVAEVVEDKQKKHFRKHPQHISDSDSDLLTSETKLTGRNNKSVLEDANTFNKSKENVAEFADVLQQNLKLKQCRHFVTNSSSDVLSSLSQTKSTLIAKSINDLEGKFGCPLERRCDSASFDKELLKKFRSEGFRSESEREVPRFMKMTESGLKKVSNTSVKPSSSSQSTLGKKKSVPDSSKDLKNIRNKSTMDFSNVLLDHTEPKLNHIMQKAYKCMVDIGLQMDAGYEMPDGTEDFERKRKRSMEFSSRFARNYLYQLNRQINDIKKLLKPTCGRISFRNCSSVMQKLVSSYQTILQGLSAYHNHLPATACLGAPDKVKEFLTSCFVLCDIHRNCLSTDINSNNKTHEIIDVFEARTKNLLDKIDEVFNVTSAVSLAQSNRSRFSVEKLTRKKNVVKSRYSMYATMPSRKDYYWKKAVACLAKKKFNVQSKYKTASFKHRPPIEKLVVIKQPPKTVKTLDRKSTTSLKPSKYLMNDDVQTMMQVEEKKEEDSGVKDSLNDAQNATKIDNGMLIPFVEKMLQKLTEDSKDVSQHQVKNILQGLTEMVRTCGSPETKKNEDIAGIDEAEGGKRVIPSPPSPPPAPSQPSTDAGNALQRVCTTPMVKDRRESREEGKRRRNDGKKEIKREEINKRGKKQIVTVTGVKNAQLICIKDEDSLTESSAVEKEIGFATNVSINQQPPTKPPSKINLATSERASKIKISRISKHRLTKLEMLPKEYALNVLQYKVEFGKAKKNNPMYRKSAHVQPWVLMGIIADKILDELLASLGKEIQVNDVIERIYASEFM